MTAQTYLDPTLSPDVRADLLAREMTTLEQCYQLAAVPPWWLALADGTDPDGLPDLLAKAPGHVRNFSTDDPARMAETVERIQRTAVERTRLGIPILFHAEALNGYMSGGHMVFPTGIALAAGWSPDLVQEMADLIRRQMRQVGVRQALSPNMDVALDPRWGRVHESYGEDPYLCAALSVAYTRGLQGNDLTKGVIATAKHFVGYTNLGRDFAVEPARVDVYLGLDAHDRQAVGAFEVTGDPRVLSSAERSFFSRVVGVDV